MFYSQMMRHSYSQEVQVEKRAKAEEEEKKTQALPSMVAALVI
jgi:hypothetical protein